MSNLDDYQFSEDVLALNPALTHSKTPSRRSSEHDAQVAVFRWAERKAASVPELSLLFAIPNGGHRHIQVARAMKAEGARAGVPDMFLPVARGRYHGLFLELKVGNNRPTARQNDWLDRLDEQGYFAAVAYGAQQAIEIILAYLTEN